jgi:hypothetical protein
MFEGHIIADEYVASIRSTVVKEQKLRLAGGIVARKVLFLEATEDPEPSKEGPLYSGPDALGACMLTCHMDCTFQQSPYSDLLHFCQALTLLVLKTPLT